MIETQALEVDVESEVEIQQVPENPVGYVRPRLYPKQLRALFNTKLIGCCEASTKSGKTHAAIVWLSEQAVLYGGRNMNFWWVAPVSDQTDIAFRRICLALPKDSFTKNLTRKTITLNHNGATIWFKSGDAPDSLFGEDVYAAIVDEASRVKEESWQALWSTLTATQGPVRIIGNVKGRANWMYRLARVAKSGDPDMHYEKITCMDAVAAGVITQESVDRARKLLPEDVFKELYLAEAGEDGGNPFGIGHIYRAINPEGLSLKTPIAWGWDVAKHQNWTVGVGLDDDGAVCRFMRFQDMWEPTLERITKATVKVPALIDSTGSGDQVLERLRTQGHTNFEGQLFGGWKAKYELMLGLAVAIQNGDVSFPAGRIVEELEAFEYEDKGDMVLYTSPKGVHDDCVDALAMAVKRKMTLDTRSYITDAIPLSFEQASGWVIR